MSREQYEETVFRATAHIGANLEKQLSIPELARQLGYSNRYLLKAFRMVLNQSVVDYIRLARINKAKALLAKSQLSITSIAFDSGFESYVDFARVFRTKVGITPMNYRKKVSLLKESPISDTVGTELEKKEEWFKDSFPAKQMAAHWEPVVGRWCQVDGSMHGTAANNEVRFLRPLPENCRISFQVRTKPHLQLGEPSFFVRLKDKAGTFSYCELSLATGNRATGLLLVYGNVQRWNPNARVSSSEWAAIALEIREECLRLLINGAEAFALRDSFPPTYASRCFLEMGSWHCNLQIREFTIENLGYRPVIHPIRQGDTLYSAGLHEKAMEFYSRYLQAGAAGDVETMELRYKIGMCCIRLGAFSQAKSWLENVISLREDRFWAEQAQVSFLELCWKMQDLPGLQEQMHECFKETAAQDHVRVIAQSAVREFGARGFFKEADLVLETWSALEPVDSFHHQILMVDLAEHNQNMRQFDKAEEILKRLATGSSVFDIVLWSHTHLMQLYHEWGRIDESERTREELEQRTEDPFFLARCMLQHAANLRAKEKFDRSLDILQRVPGKYPFEPNFLSHAKIQIAFILCCVGKLEEGRKALEEARLVDPNRHLNSGHYLPFFLAEGNYATAAESLLNDYRNSKELVSSSAELGVKAGILHELAGLREEAKAIFKEVSLRFPKEQVRFFGQLAHELFAGEDFDARGMPYEHFRRSEMFYSIGLLHRVRGDREAARALFELCVKEDPALRWPAYFAKQKMKGG